MRAKRVMSANLPRTETEEIGIVSTHYANVSTHYAKWRRSGYYASLRTAAKLALKADPEGPALISYAALQHGSHFIFYAFRDSAAHILSLYLLSSEGIIA